MKQLVIAPPKGTSRETLLQRLTGLQPALRGRFRASVPADAQARVREAMEQVTAGQMEALVLLHEHPAGLSMHELAQSLCSLPSSATQLVDRLVRAGMVERMREEDDRRLVRVRLSASARQKFSEMISLRLQSLAAVIAPLSDEELRILIGLLEKISQPHPSEMPS
jgi:DNA-binding MarR family transcriptional regulator